MNLQKMSKMRSSSHLTNTINNYTNTLSNCKDTQELQQLLSNPEQVANFNPEMYPDFQNLNPETQLRMKALFGLAAKQQQLLSQSISSVSELEQQANGSCKKLDHPAREADFARCFSSTHLPVVVVDRGRAHTIFTSDPSHFPEGSLFCNQAFGSMLNVDISEFTSASFNHSNIGAHTWTSFMSQNKMVKEIAETIFQSDVEYVQCKMLLQDSQGHHFFVNAKMHLWKNFVWVVFDPSAFIDDELQVDNHIHHSTQKFRDLNLWRKWMNDVSSCAHTYNWLHEILGKKSSPTSEPSSASSSSEGNNSTQKFNSSVPSSAQSSPLITPSPSGLGMPQNLSSMTPTFFNQTPSFQNMGSNGVDSPQLNLNMSNPSPSMTSDFKSGNSVQPDWDSNEEEPFGVDKDLDNTEDLLY